MGPVLPSPDLNLNINPTASTPTAGAGTNLPTVIPQKELKLELFDGPGEIHFQTPQPFFFSYPDKQQPISSFNFNPTQTQASPISPTAPTPTPTPIPTPQNLPSSSSSTDASNVYSEFIRISKLFQAAFSQGIQKDITEEFTPLEDSNNSRAIVPVNADENNEIQLSNVVVSRKCKQRSRERIRVTDLSSDDVLYFRDVLRKHRKVYDSLRVFPVSEDEIADVDASQRRVKARPDLQASTLMRKHGLWLNRDKRIVGKIPGVEIGDVFFFRKELCVVGIHGQGQAGIDYLPGSRSSNGEPIATSVIVSGGYEDDENSGDVIIYTGQGGQDKHNRTQCMNQKLAGGNLALEKSMYYGIEVRVIRRFKHDGSVSGKIYVYDGLYKIVQSWFDVSESGFGVFKYKLVRLENQPEMGSSILKFAMTLRSRPLDARPKGYVTFDLSMNKENVPVYLFNDVDSNDDPVSYEYLVRTVFPQIVHQGRKVTGCECVGECQDGCFCADKNGRNFAYDQNGILIRGKPVVIECGPHCHCPPTCRNRVSQRGVRNRLEVFRSRETGWGVRSLDVIQAGSFICEFSGVTLTHEQAEIFTMNGDSLIYPSRFAERWREWGDLSKIYSEFEHPSFPSIPPMDFAMDVSRLRNVAYYVRHSSTPNLLVQPVLYDQDTSTFPRLMLFAMENIPPLRELSLDYGVEDEFDWKISHM